MHITNRYANKPEVNFISQELTFARLHQQQMIYLCSIKDLHAKSAN